MSTKWRKWLWPVVGTLAAVAEVVQSTPNYLDLSWHQLLSLGLKALPFCLFGFIAKAMLFQEPPKDG